MKVGFLKCPYEHTLFKYENGGKMLIVCLYVDDLIFTGNCEIMFQEFKKSMMDEFEMFDLDVMHYFLGIEVVKARDGIFISQKKYIGEILDKFQMKDYNPANTPTEFGLKLNKDHEGKKVDNTFYKQIVGKRIICYLQGTRNFGIFYRKGGKSILFGFSDSDYAGDQGDSTSVFMFGTSAISWSSKKQSIVTLSSTEAEFVVATTCTCQAIWQRRILEELKFKQPETTTVFCDNSSTIKLSKNPVPHGRNKHIGVRFYFLRDLTNERVIDLKFCRSDEQLADMFTKSLKISFFQNLRRLIKVCTLGDPI